MTEIKAFLVLTVAALYLAVAPWGVRVNNLALNTQIGSSFLKKSWNIPLTIGKTVSKLKAIVSLDTFNTDTSAGVLFH